MTPESSVIAPWLGGSISFLNRLAYYPLVRNGQSFSGTWRLPNPPRKGSALSARLRQKRRGCKSATDNNLLKKFAFIIRNGVRCDHCQKTLAESEPSPTPE